MNSVDRLIDFALQEDIGPGDITTDATVPPDAGGTGDVIAKEDFVLAGLEVARKVFERLDDQIKFSSEFEDGAKIEKGRIVFSVEGRLSSILKGERTALNFIQRLSGIATLARRFVDAMKSKNARIVDTRKTTPGWRELEKYAVRIGGASNHRMGLFDGVLIKDNHIAACGGVRNAVERARKNIHHLAKIEVEVSDMTELAQALEAGADVVMLDNMTPEQIEKAVGIIDKRALVEVSGGVGLDNVVSMAETGVDLVSVGALTHSAKAVDISMKIRNSPSKDERDVAG